MLFFTTEPLEPLPPGDGHSFTLNWSEGNRATAPSILLIAGKTTRLDLTKALNGQGNPEGSRFAAIALVPRTGQWAYAHGKPSLDEAKESALAKCKQNDARVGVLSPALIAFLRKMLPNCHLVAGCLLHREFGKSACVPA